MLIETDDVEGIRIEESPKGSTIRLTMRGGSWVDLAVGTPKSAVNLTFQKLRPCLRSYDFKEANKNTISKQAAAGCG